MMPCYSRETSTVEFGEGTDVKLLAAALKQLGYTVNQFGQRITFANYAESVTGTFAGGKMTIQSPGPIDQNTLKRAYSAEVVKSAAQRFGWTAKQTGAQQFQVSRRV
jgi:hypothetical protein